MASPSGAPASPRRNDESLLRVEVLRGLMCRQAVGVEKLRKGKCPII